MADAYALQDPEMNRPGMKGFRTPKKNKKAATPEVRHDMSEFLTYAQPIWDVRGIKRRRQARASPHLRSVAVRRLKSTMHIRKIRNHQPRKPEPRLQRPRRKTQMGTVQPKSQLPKRLGADPKRLSRRTTMRLSTTMNLPQRRSSRRRIMMLLTSVKLPKRRSNRKIVKRL